MSEKIVSLQNPKIKEVVKLRKASVRKANDAIIVEGKAEISLAIKAGLEIASFFYCPGYAGKTRADAEPAMAAQTYAGKIFLFRANAEKIIEVAPEVFNKISYREHPDGYLALAKPAKLNLEGIKLSKNPLLIVLESVEKPGNLGAILRTADAANVDAVIACDLQTDIYNPNVIRSSLGTIFTNQVATCETGEAIEWLRKNGISIYAATPMAGKFYFDCNFKKAAAIVIGAENEGLSKIWLDAAEEKIKIPMLGKIDSLNASVGAAILAFEAVRQRMAGLNF